MGQQITGVTGNGCQRRADVVGDGAQQIGAQLLVPDCNGCLLLFFGIAEAFQSKGALALDRGQHAVGEGLHRVTVQVNAEHTVAISVDADRAVQGSCCPIVFFMDPGGLLMPINPSGDFRLIFIREKDCLLALRCAGNGIGSDLFVIFPGIDYRGALYQGCDLPSRDAEHVA